MNELIKNGWMLVGAAFVTPALYYLIRRKSNSESSSTTPDTAPAASTALVNLRAFLLTIQHSEGTIGPNAYRTFYGGGLFNSYAAHPNTKNTRWGLTSTAAGAYQMLYGTWATMQAKLNLPDFSPQSQDKAAIELIRMKGALPDIAAGNIPTAFEKCRKVWASLPGAGYGQGEHSLSNLLAAYRSNGGTIA